MKKQLLTLIGAAMLAGGVAQASPIPEGHFLLCKGDGQTLLVLPGVEKDVYQLAVRGNGRVQTVSRNLKYSATVKAFVGHVTEDTALKAKGFTPRGPITLDVNAKRFVVQDPYTGSASVFAQPVECSVNVLADI